MDCDKYIPHHVVWFNTLSAKSDFHVGLTMVLTNMEMICDHK